MRFVFLLAIVAACGRIGIEERTGIGSNPDSSVLDPDGNPPTDTPATCPNGTTPIESGSSVCIEQAERGTKTWTIAKATCEGLNPPRRLCMDAEWATACDNASGLIDMFNDEGGASPNWEWVADLVVAGEAAKRGYDACGATSSHEIFIDPYDYRCCLDL